MDVTDLCSWSVTGADVTVMFVFGSDEGMLDVSSVRTSVMMVAQILYRWR